MKIRILTGCLLAVALAPVLPALAGVDDDEAALARMVIGKSGITATVAIEKALGKFPGIVYEYELDEDDDRFVHEVEIANLESRRTHKISIDAQSGEIVEVESSRASSWFSDSDEVRAAGEISKYNFSLVDAIGRAVSDGNALLTEVEFEQKQGISFFKVEFVDKDGEKDALVDMESRDLIPSFGQ